MSKTDFNGDGRSDLLLRNDDGWLTDWLGTESGDFVNNGVNASIFFEPRNVITPGLLWTLGWQVVGTGDFNGDGRDDFLLRHTSGWVTDWLGTSSGGFTNNGANASLFFGTDWSVVGTGDYNGDGKTDLLLKNSSGWLTNWLGTSSGGFTNNGANTSLFFTNDWLVVGSGDFNGDGRDDILLRNQAGWVTDWLGTADGGFVNNGANTSLLFGNDWRVAGTGDFNGDGKDDMLLRSDAGWVTDWLGTADGGFINNGANTSQFFTADWQIASTGDFNGDGKDDFIVRQDSRYLGNSLGQDSGFLSEWLGTANGSFVNSGVAAFAPVDWHVQPYHDPCFGCWDY